MSAEQPMKTETELARAVLQQDPSIHPSVNPALGEYLQDQALPADLLGDRTQITRRWQQLRQVQQARQQRRQRSAARWASVALLLMIIGVAWRIAPHHAYTPVEALTQGAFDSGVSEENASLAVLRDLSQQLEHEWQAQQQRPRTLSGAQLAYQQQLSQLIASLDAQLGQPVVDQERQWRLWQQRVVLMNELVANETQLSSWSQTVAL